MTNKTEELKKEIEKLDKISLDRNTVLYQSLKSELKGRQEALKEVEELVDECSIPVMDDEAMDKFIEENSESSIYRIVDFDKLKQKIKS